MRGRRAERFCEHTSVRNPPVKSIGECRRLLEDFLLHVVAIGALFRGLWAPARLMHRARYVRAIGPKHAHVVASDFGKIALLQIDEALRHGKKGRHPACDEVLADAKADHQRARDACHDDSIWIVCIKHQQCIRSREPLH